MLKKCNKFKNNNDAVDSYPSAELLQNLCYNEYMRQISTYDKIYDRVNIALSICAIMLTGIARGFDYTIFLNYDKTRIDLIVLLKILSSVSGLIMIVWAVIYLIWMLRSRKLIMFDIEEVCKQKKYMDPINEVSVWLITLFTASACELKKVNDRKIRRLDSVIIKIIIAMVSYIILIILNKGVI